MLLAWGGALAPQSAVVARLTLDSTRVVKGTHRQISIDFTNPYPQTKVLRAVVSGVINNYGNYSFLNIQGGNNYDASSGLHNININQTHNINAFIGAGTNTFTMIVKAYPKIGKGIATITTYGDLSLTFYYKN